MASRLFLSSKNFSRIPASCALLSSPTPTFVAQSAHFSTFRFLQQQESSASNGSSLTPPSELGAYEQSLFKMLTSSLEPTALDVRDISGGCGSMFYINIISPKFNGVPLVKQHKLVNEVLKDEISKWHGLQLRTKAADKAK